MNKESNYTFPIFIIIIFIGCKSYKLIMESKRELTLEEKMAKLKADFEASIER